MVIADYLLDNLLAILIAVGGAIAWFFDKRRRVAEIENLKSTNKQTETSALQGMQEAYDKFVLDVNSQIDDLREKNYTLRKELKSLQEQLDTANTQRKKLEDQVKRFEVQSEKDAILIKQLKRAVEGYEERLNTSKKDVK